MPKHTKKCRLLSLKCLQHGLPLWMVVGLIVLGALAGLMNSLRTSAGITINTNVASLEAQRHLQATQEALSKSFQRLSSGLRINSAADDAAGLGVSEELEKKIKALEDQSKNVTVAIDVTQVVGDVVSKIEPSLSHLRELGLAAADHPERKRTEATKELNNLYGARTQLTDARTAATLPLVAKKTRSAINNIQRVVDEATASTAMYFSITPSRGKRFNSKTFQNKIDSSGIILRREEQKIVDVVLDIDAAANQVIQEVEDFMDDPTTNEYYEFPSLDEQDDTTTEDSGTIEEAPADGSSTDESTSSSTTPLTPGADTAR